MSKAIIHDPLRYEKAALYLIRALKTISADVSSKYDYVTLKNFVDEGELSSVSIEACYRSLRRTITCEGHFVFYNTIFEGEGEISCVPNQTPL